jgi:hypothetical protein
MPGKPGINAPVWQFRLIKPQMNADEREWNQNSRNRVFPNLTFIRVHLRFPKSKSDVCQRAPGGLAMTGAPSLVPELLGL